MAAGDGLVSMTPTSIAHSGTSASINADGGVDFSAVTSLSLNGVFTSDYDNYLVVIEATISGNAGTRVRWRAAGTDNSTASSYVFQQLTADNTSVSGSRSTSNEGTWGSFGSGNRNGITAHVYGPALAQPTASRSVNVETFNTLRVGNFAFTHNQSTAYDGFTFYPTSNNITGNVHVFGYEE